MYLELYNENQKTLEKEDDIKVIIMLHLKLLQSK